MSGDLRRLAAGLFVVAWGTNVSTPLILRYQDRLDLSDTGAVGIFTVYVAGILLALLFAGRSSDRIGRRAVVLPSTALSAAGSVILILGRDSLLVLFAGRFLLGAVSGAMLSVGTAWMNEVAARTADSGVDAARRLRLATMTTIIMYVGFGFGPMTSALWERFGPNPLVVPFVVHAVATIVVLIVMLPVPETKGRDATVSLRPRLGIPPTSRHEFLRTLAPASIWAFGFPSVSFALFPIILRDAIGGADVLVAGATGSLTALVVLLSRPILNRIGDARRALPIAVWMGVCGYLVGLVAFTTGWWLLLPLAAVLLGSASGVLMSAGLAITDEISDVSNQGALSSTFYFIAYLGMAMPVVITGLARVSSTTVALAVVTGVAAAAAITVTLGTRQRLNSREPA